MASFRLCARYSARIGTISILDPHSSFFTSKVALARIGSSSRFGDQSVIAARGQFMHHERNVSALAFPDEERRFGAVVC
jgi:hypothetical protein